LGHDPLNDALGLVMSKSVTFAIKLLGAGAAILLGATVVHAQDPWSPPIRFGNTSTWHYDARNDRRDFPANGYFPGNFAAKWWAPPAAGLFGFRYERSPIPYPSQVYFGRHCPPCAPPRD
jgi:hypothetical protein